MDLSNNQIQEVVGVSKLSDFFNNGKHINLSYQKATLDKKNISITDLNANTLLPPIIQMYDPDDASQPQVTIKIANEKGEMIYSPLLKDMMEKKIDYRAILKVNTTYHVVISTDFMIDPFDDIYSYGGDYFEYDLTITDSEP